MSLGNNIKKLRKSLGRSQKEIASKIGISQSTMSNLEKNEANIGIITLQKVATELRVPISVLFESPDIFIFVKKDFKKENLTIEDLTPKTFMNLSTVNGYAQKLGL